MGLNYPGALVLSHFLIMPSCNYILGNLYATYLKILERQKGTVPMVAYAKIMNAQRKVKYSSPIQV